MLITTLNYSTLIRKREKHNDQIPGRRSGKDLQLPNSSVTNSTLNLRQMFPYANKELSDKTSNTFFLPHEAALLQFATPGRQPGTHKTTRTHLNNMKHFLLSDATAISAWFKATL